MRAAGVNRADILQRLGRYPPPPGASPILGLEVAGVVEQVAADAPRLAAAAEGHGGELAAPWQPGEKVFGLLSGGGYAEYVTLPVGLALPIPAALSFEEAAAIPEAFLTAYQCLLWLGGIEAGQVVLIHAGASGVGTAAIQLVHEAGARPFVTAGSAAKLAACGALGAEVAVNYREGPFAPPVLAAAPGGADLILDFVGAPYWEQNLVCLATDGRLILVGTLGGARLENVDLRALMTKRATVIGTHLRSRSLDYRVRLTRDFAAFALPRFADGRLRPVLDRVFSWEAAGKAHRYLEESRNVGKVVLNGM